MKTCYIILANRTRKTRNVLNIFDSKVEVFVKEGIKKKQVVKVSLLITWKIWYSFVIILNFLCSLSLLIIIAMI